MHIDLNINAKDVAKYTLLPGIIPRTKNLVNSGFSWLAMLMASIYGMVRLLPPEHPYLNPANKGRFGIRHVIIEAANNLKFSKNNIDQIIVFFILLAGFIALIMQFALLFFVFVVKPAYALGPFTSIFYTNDCYPTPIAGGCTDIAFQLLDIVFAVPDMYGSTYAPTSPAAIPPYNQALHALFEFYSLAILIVAVLIFLYYVLLVVGETAQTGTPFGRRFQHIWAPLRLVAALGLLVPINFGLNSAQFITLVAARMGSSMATNGWVLFNSTLTNAAEMSDDSLIARPSIPDITGVVSFMYLAVTCKWAYKFAYDKEIKPYLIYRGPDPITGGPGLYWSADEIVDTGSPDYLTALEKSTYQDVIITFGHKAAADSGGERYPRSKGGVREFCGQIRIHTNDTTQVGALDIQANYYYLILDFWEDKPVEEFSKRMAAIYIESSPEKPSKYFQGGPPWEIGNINDNQQPSSEFKENEINYWLGQFESAIIAARDKMVSETEFAVPDDLLKRGWAGAAIWYNRIAEWNGALLGAAANVPTPSMVPLVMQKVEEQRRQSDATTDATHRYEPYLAGAKPVHLEGKDGQIANALNKVYIYWRDNKATEPSEVRTQGNMFYDILNIIFGLDGLFTIRANKDIHPLAQLVAIGKSILDTTIRNLMYGLGFAAAGGFTTALEEHAGAGFMGLSTFAVSIATMGLTIGFILYYVLPFLPFIYFFFAVGGWVKSIFEAMVGVPLWALAHLRIDGNGLPGDTASNGYFLIFEIFVRPILTLFGLLASIVIFSAMVRVLHDIFPLLIENSAGFETESKVALFPGIEFKRNSIDEFFFTIVYTIMVYMIGTSAFKMIDQVPNNILRWMGAGVQSFNDQSGDPTQGLVSYAAFGGANMAGQVVGASQEAARGVGLTGGLLGKRLGILGSRAREVGNITGQ